MGKEFSLSAALVPSLCLSPCSIYTIPLSSHHFGPSNSAEVAYEMHLQSFGPFVYILLLTFCVVSTLWQYVLPCYSGWTCLWKAKAPLFSTANQDFYSCVIISKMMELLERKKCQYVIFLYFMTEADSQHFLAWLLFLHTSAQVRGNCLSSSELEARDWHLLKWNTPHSLHFLIKPQALPSSWSFFGMSWHDML